MSINWDTYVNRKISCSCGRTHLCDIESIVLEEHALERLPGLIQAGGFTAVCMLEDTNTKAAAGDAVQDLLAGAGIAAGRITLEAAGLLPDEQGIGSVLTELPAGCDLLVAAGSGTINDLARFVSFKLGIPYYIVATAPSMDGFTSNVAAMITKQAKTTYEAHKPAAVIGDLAILSEAPMDLIAAGVGDVLGKYICLTDWKAAHLITGEYYCPFVEELVQESIRRVCGAVEGILTREADAVAELTEGLILSGIAMSYTGNSRPASGSEHHLGHFWEMMFLQHGEHGAWHGAKVGVGTVTALRLYEMLAEASIDFSAAASYTFEEQAWAGQIRAVYGQAAPSVLKLEEQEHKNSTRTVRSRLPLLQEHMPAILAMAAKLPSSQRISNLLASLNAPFHPQQIGVDRQMFCQSILYARELRNRYGLLQILNDLGLLESFAERLADEWYRGKD